MVPTITNQAARLSLRVLTRYWLRLPEPSSKFRSETFLETDTSRFPPIPIDIYIVGDLES